MVNEQPRITRHSLGCLGIRGISGQLVHFFLPVAVLYRAWRIGATRRTLRLVIFDSFDRAQDKFSIADLSGILFDGLTI